MVFFLIGIGNFDLSDSYRSLSNFTQRRVKGSSGSKPVSDNQRTVNQSLLTIQEHL